MARNGHPHPVTAARLAALLVLLVPLIQPSTAVPQPPAASESALTAAYVFNFAKFVDWPADVFADPAAPLVLCVAGVRRELTDAFRGLAGKVAKTRSLAVRADLSPDDLRECHLLFVGDDGLDLAARRGLLTVGDARDFVKKGGVIELFVAEGRLRFRINEDAAKLAELTVSSQLLVLAQQNKK